MQTKKIVSICLSVCNHSADATKISIGFSLVHLLVSGIFWPVEGMPRQWMMSLVRAMPHTEAIEAGLANL